MTVLEAPCHNTLVMPFWGKLSKPNGKNALGGEEILAQNVGFLILLILLFRWQSDHSRLISQSIDKTIDPVQNAWVWSRAEMGEVTNTVQMTNSLCFPAMWHINLSFSPYPRYLGSSSGNPWTSYVCFEIKVAYISWVFKKCPVFEKVDNCW